VLVNNINKIIINYQKYKKLLSFSKKNKNFLSIQGFFGSVTLKIPSLQKKKREKEREEENDYMFRPYNR
jgi:hypothetical protein